jgi:hypothetical protein
LAGEDRALPGEHRSIGFRRADLGPGRQREVVVERPPEQPGHLELLALRLHGEGGVQDLAANAESLAQERLRPGVRAHGPVEQGEAVQEVGVARVLLARRLLPDL